MGVGKCSGVRSLSVCCRQGIHACEQAREQLPWAGYAEPQGYAEHTQRHATVDVRSARYAVLCMLFCIC